MQSTNHTEARARLLRDYPFQAAWEAHATVYTFNHADEVVEISMGIILEDLRLAWAAALAVFGEKATADLAWKIFMETRKDCGFMEEGPAVNKLVSRNALIEQIHPALAQLGWHLVDSIDDWFQNGKKIRTYYVIDHNDDVVEPYFDLNALAKDLRVLGECEIGDGCGTPWNMRDARWRP